GHICRRRGRHDAPAARGRADVGWTVDRRGPGAGRRAGSGARARGYARGGGNRPRDRRPGGPDRGAMMRRSGTGAIPEYTRFTPLLVGLDGSPRADAAFEQAVLLGERFRSTLIAAYVREGRHGADGAAMLDRARERVLAAGLKVETTAVAGDADVELATLAKTADAVLVGRRGVTTKESALVPTVISLIRIAHP